MTTYIHKRKVINIVLRNGQICIVCDNPIVDLTDAVITLVDSDHGPFMSNLRLRHSLCQRSKYRPVMSPDVLERLFTAMINDDTKICPACRRSWVDNDPEDLILARHVSDNTGTERVLHRLCVGK